MLSQKGPGSRLPPSSKGTRVGSASAVLRVPTRLYLPTSRSPGRGRLDVILSARCAPVNLVIVAITTCAKQDLEITTIQKGPVERVEISCDENTGKPKAGQRYPTNVYQGDGYDQYISDSARDNCSRRPNDEERDSSHGNGRRTSASLKRRISANVGTSKHADGAEYPVLEECYNSLELNIKQIQIRPESSIVSSTDQPRLKTMVSFALRRSIASRPSRVLVSSSGLEE